MQKFIHFVIRCDLIRFIVGVIHPTNELLCSDIIPRWAVIGKNCNVDNVTLTFLPSFMNVWLFAVVAVCNCGVVVYHTYAEWFTHLHFEIFLGWLLTTCTNPVAASNAKLALFYDWLFYDQEKVGIMF